MRHYKAQGGENVTTTARKMVDIANVANDEVEADFNEITLRAKPGDTPESIVDFFDKECTRRHEAYIASDEYKEHRRQAEERQRQKDAALAAALSVAPATMSLRDKAGWEKSVSVNTDPYGSAVMRYAERWARIMEGRITNGATVESCAYDASHIADSEGITGFMYGCAVSVLAQVWEHGEELRRWHNLKTQLRGEGEEANENGGVLNPALLSIR